VLTNDQQRAVDPGPQRLPQLTRQPRARHRGTDNALDKGGDYFGVTAGRTGTGSPGR
jgi:hypothetical protein